MVFLYYQYFNIPQNGVHYYLKIQKITISHLFMSYLGVRNLSKEVLVKRKATFNNGKKVFVYPAKRYTYSAI